MSNNHNLLYSYSDLCFSFSFVAISKRILRHYQDTDKHRSTLCHFRYYFNQLARQLFESGPESYQNSFYNEKDLPFDGNYIDSRVDLAQEVLNVLKSTAQRSNNCN